MGKKNTKKNKQRGIYWIPIFSFITIVLFALILLDPIKTQLFGNRQVQKIESQTVLGTPVPLPTLTPLPEDYPNLPREYFENENQTTGIILGGTILIMIIMIGTLVSLRNERKKR